jgi:hypothetical protein
VLRPHSAVVGLALPPLTMVARVSRRTAVVKIPRLRLAGGENRAPASAREPKSSQRIDITPRYRDTRVMTTKIESFMHSVG